ncbi:MAG TPA: O-antigen ligase family protein [Gaiellaceae bacterium]|nr:O-antigen ligase family protein [Gaiellaceae bacterium]
MRGAQPESLGADAAASAVRPRAFAPDLSHVAVGIAAAAGVGALGAADGGYFPPAWGWTALVALWLVIAWLLLGRAALHGGRLAGVFLGGLTALAAWTWLSLVWSDNTTQTVLEGFRMLAYAGVAAALVLVVRRETAPALLRGVLAALVLVSAYGLATRLFPDRLGTYDPVSGYRLSEPLGYWNGFGVFVAIGLLLALGATARERNVAVRALAGASFVVLLPALYFTFSRGAWIALAAGLAAAVALDPRRLQLIVALLVVGAPALLAAAIGSSYEGLTRTDSPLSVATDQGGELAIVIAVLALVAAVATVGLSVAERRYVPPRNVRLGFAASVALVTLAALIAVVVRFGGPVDMAERAYDAFTAPPAGSATDLGERLFTFSGSYRPELWEEAWDQWRDNPLLGGGAGTYEQYWNEHRPLDHKVRDSHNLYLETLGELGPIGLAALLLALGAPVAAAFGARRHPLAAGAFGAYVAYLVHAGVDWDWELPAITVAALAAGAALIVLRAPSGSELVPGFRLRVAAGVVAALMAGAAFVGLVGSSARAASDDAAVASPPDLDEAADEARKAQDWAPWSSEPWQRLGEAQLAGGDLAGARESFENAIDNEPGDWLLWLRLAEASSGADREAALREAERLNPLAAEIREFRETEEP